LDEACVDTLAAPRAEVGNFEAAVGLEREAIGMRPQRAPNVVHYRVRMDAYEAKKPHREAIKNGTLNDFALGIDNEFVRVDWLLT
jgi:hypothetical protein